MDNLIVPILNEKRLGYPSQTERGWRRWMLEIGVRALICNGLVMAWCGDAMAQGKSKPIQIVAFGDSLSAGYGLKAAEAFPAQLERALKAKGYDVIVVNASVSGDTTAAGRDRLEWSLPAGADAAIVELGANDALRGLAPAQALKNLDTIIATLKAKRIDVLLAGMRAPRNLGEPYTRAFDRIFPELATKHDTLLYDFFLDRIALKPEFNLADGVHPNARGVGEIVIGILPAVEKLIERVKQRRTANKS